MNKEVPQWFSLTMIEGMAALRVLKLRNPPSGETIPGTSLTVADANARTWITVLWPARGWTEKSVPHLARTFSEWARRNEEWPTIAAFLELFDEVRAKAHREETVPFQDAIPAPVWTPDKQARIEAARQRFLVKLDGMKKVMFAPSLAARKAERNS